METLPTSLAVLPVGGVAWLCRCTGPEVFPLVKAPGAADAHHAFAPDASALAVLDMDRKRAGLFRIRGDSPWIDRLLPFSNLPKGCVGHAIATTGESLIVGGHSESKESLWIRTSGHNGAWRPVVLPEGIGSPGKAIDGLLLDNSRLIAVDDILFPKWVIDYRLGDPGGLQDPRPVLLPAHITFERIHAAALGCKWVALISNGMNHGSKGSFISLLTRDTFQEQAVWSAHSHSGLFDDGSPDDLSPIDLALLDAKDLGFVRKTLLVACGTHGLLSTSLEGWIPSSPEPPPLREVRDPRTGSRQMVEDASAPVEAGGPGPSFMLRQLPGLASVDKIVSPTPPDPAGVFVTGLGEGGQSTYAWVATLPTEGAR